MWLEVAHAYQKPLNTPDAQEQFDACHHMRRGSSLLVVIIDEFSNKGEKPPSSSPQIRGIAPLHDLAIAGG